MTMKKLLVLAVSILMLFTFAACNPLDAAQQAAAQFLDGEVTGTVGKLYATEWFEFEIKSIEVVDEYAGHTPAEGFVLVDVVVYEKNTFSESIPMGTFDFYVDDPMDTDYYVKPIDPLDDTMMPTSFNLAVDEEVEYHMVFEVHADAGTIKLMYTEFGEDSDGEETEGATFTIPYDLP